MILGVSIMAIFAIGTIAIVPVAWAYEGLGSATSITLEEQLELAERKVRKLMKIPQQVQELHTLMQMVY